MLRKTTMYLDDATRKELKHLAIELDCDMAALIRMAIDQFLAGHKTKKGGKR
jgi:predicted transcriptional regulator